MKKLSETYKELGIVFTFPIEIKDSKGNETYFEDSDGEWCKSEYNSDGNKTYHEDSDGDWHKSEYDSNGIKTYYKNSTGFWYKCEYDSKGNETYYEGSNGNKRGIPRSQTCDGKVIEVDGKKYKLTEL